MNTNPPPAASPAPVKELKSGDTVLQFFLLKAKESRKTRSGQEYLDLTLSDASGTIAAKMWSDAIRKWGLEFDIGACVKVEGRVETYKDQPQIIIDKIRKAVLDEAPDPRTLIPSSPMDSDHLMEELRKIAASLQPYALAEFVRNVLDVTAQDFKTFPAARMVHHAYQGGLVEHVYSVTIKALAMSDVDPAINRNLAGAGAILHDIGKLKELNPVSASSTLEGRLVGHIILGINLLRETAQKCGVLSEPWFTEIEHIVLSHHGEAQFGAPLKPLTREALLVHFMDNLDAKMKIMNDALESADSEGFAPYNKWLEGRAYAGYGGSIEEEDDD
jgi:3'-5' exoribonuclease